MFKGEWIFLSFGHKTFRIVKLCTIICWNVTMSIIRSTVSAMIKRYLKIFDRSELMHVISVSRLTYLIGNYALIEKIFDNGKPLGN